MRRRMFLLKCVGGAAAVPALVQLMGCYGDGHYPPSDPEDQPSGTASSVDAGTSEAFTVWNSDDSGHSHSFELKCTHAGATGWTYMAQGGHTHQVVLTGEQLADIFAGDTVTVRTEGGHAHTWVIKRPDNAC